MNKPLILVTPTATALPQWEDADYAAVDGGLEILRAAGITPVFACGDFDSLKQPLQLDSLPVGCRILSFPAEKNESDSQLAIEEGIRLGYGPIILAGSLSGRIDHTLANIRLLSWSYPDLILQDDHQQMRLLQPGSHTVSSDWKHISLFALEPSCITLENMKYPLSRRNITTADIYTLSNEVGEGHREGTIIVHSGKVLLAESNLS